VKGRWATNPTFREVPQKEEEKQARGGEFLHLFGHKGLEARIWGGGETSTQKKEKDAYHSRYYFH